MNCKITRTAGSACFRNTFLCKELINQVFLKRLPALKILILNDSFMFSMMNHLMTGLFISEDFPRIVLMKRDKLFRFAKEVHKKRPECKLTLQYDKA